MVTIRTTDIFCKTAVLLLTAASLRQQAHPPTVADAFAPPGRYSDAAATRNGLRNLPTAASASTKSTTRLCAALPEGYREFGDAAILRAAEKCGMNFDEANGNRLDIEWKAGTIIVSVHGEVSLREVSDDDDDEETETDESVAAVVDEEAEGDDEDADEEEEDEIDEEFSLTLLARTINKILDDDGTGLLIAEAHSIEVTTPGVSDLLVPGTPQFEAFMGFEVIVETIDPKKKNGKATTIEGRLYERTDECTVINIKGRMKKFKNENVLAVRLPKAKKEKGAK